MGSWSDPIPRFAPKKPKIPRGGAAEHEGRVPQPGVPAGPRNTAPPTAPVSGLPPNYRTAVSSGAAPRVAQAENKQRQLVNRYVTQAYSQKTKALQGPESNRLTGVGALGVGERVEKAKQEVSDLRKRLLTHPAVKEANEAGKVVPIKGLQQLQQKAQEFHAIEGPKGASYSKRFGLTPKSFLGQPTDLQAKQETTKGMGSAGRLGARAKEVQHQKSEPSTLEDLSFASLGVPGLGVGGLAAKATEFGAETLPKLIAEEGAAQVVKSAAAGVGSKVGAGLGAAKAGGIAVLHAPMDALDAIRAGASAVKSNAPEIVKGLPVAAKSVARGTPEALGRGLKATPGVIGRSTARGAVGTAENTSKAFGGVALGTATNKVGIHIPVLTNLPVAAKGTEQALVNHPGETLATTGRIIPGFVTGPAAILESGVRSGIEGSPAPLENTVSEFAKGTAGMVGKYLSGNPKTVEETVRKETGLAPLLPAPALLHALHGSDFYTGKIRAPLRAAVENRRAGAREAQVKKSENNGINAPRERGRIGTYREKRALKPPVPVQGTGQHYIFRDIGKAIGGHKDRVNMALDAAREGAFANTWNQLEMNRLRGAAHGRPVGATNALGSLKGRLKGEGAGFGMSPLAKEMGRSYDASAMLAAKYGLPHGELGNQHYDNLSTYFGKPAEGVVRPDHAITDRIAANQGSEHAVSLDQRHQNMTNEFRGAAKRLAKELPGNYEAKPWRIQSQYTNYLRAKEGKAPILKDTERISAKAHDFTSTHEATKALRELADTKEKTAGRYESQTGDKAKVTAEKLHDEAKQLRDHAALQEKGFGPKGDQVSRQAAYAHYEKLKATEDGLRKEARTARAAGRQSEANNLYRQSRDVAHQRKGLHNELKSYVRNPEKVDTTALKASSGPMKKAFIAEQRAVAKEHGLLEPVHVHDELPQAGNIAKGVARAVPGRAIHASTGALARSGEAEARLEPVLHASQIAPRTQLALNNVIHQGVNDLKTPVRMPDGSYKHVASEAEREWVDRTHNMPAGTEWFPNALLKPALKGTAGLTSDEALKLIDDVRHAGSDQAVTDLVSKYPDIRDEVLNHGKGISYTAVRSAGMDELVKQLKGAEHSKIRTAANLPTRLILNDPAWVFAQIFAKGIPLAASLGPSALLRAPQAIKAMYQIQQKDPATRARIVSMLGSSAGVLGTPHTAFTNADPYSNVRAIRHSGPGKVVWNLANGNVMGKWDRWNAAQMREFAGAVRASKGFKNWYGGVKGLDKGMREISEATKGMSASQRLDYISKHPSLARNMQKNMNAMGGNWNSFTALERKIAPFTVFYPWIRYSMDWMFHVFPMNHPVAGTALALLAQQNANTLQKIAATEARKAGVKGVTPSTPLQDVLAYANPVSYNAKGEAVENPKGIRYAPGLGVTGQTIASGDPLKALGATNPLINTTASLLTGTNTFTGEKLKGGLLANAADQLISLSPLARQAEAAIGFRGFAKEGTQSATSKAYEILQGGKAAKNLRSFAAPYLPRSGSKGGLEDALNVIEKRIEKTGGEAQKNVEFNLANPTSKNKKQAEKLKTENKEAWEQKEKLLLKIGGPALAKQSKEEYEHYKASLPALFGGSSTFGSGFGSGFGKGFGSSFGSSSKNLPPYKPPGEEGVHIPNISLPKIGNIMGAISNLIAGTPAQAATSKSKAQPVTLKGPLTAGQKTFGKELVKQTGLSPKAAGAWMLAEESSTAAQGRQGEGNQNWLNIGPGATLSKNPKVAARETANLINSSGNYAGIRSSVGKGAAAQAAAIGASPWGTVGSTIQGALPLVSGSGGGKGRGGKTAYANPLPGWSPGRSDQGYDASPTKANQPVLAVAKSKVIAVGAPGWPEGGGVTYRLLEGPQKGKEVYAFEGLNATVKPGQIVKRGQVVARGRLGGSIETGYYSGNQTVGGHPLHNQVLGSGQTYTVAGTDGQQTVGSAEFEKQILGNAVEVPASGKSAGFIVTGPTVAAYSQATGTAPAQVVQQLKAHKLQPQTMLQKLAAVERAVGSQLTPLGIPALAPTSGTTPTALATLGKSLEEQRRKLRSAGSS